jgi:hypothetical protein
MVGSLARSPPAASARLRTGASGTSREPVRVHTTGPSDDRKWPGRPRAGAASGRRPRNRDYDSDHRRPRRARAAGGRGSSNPFVDRWSPDAARAIRSVVHLRPAEGWRHPAGDPRRGLSALTRRCARSTPAGTKRRERQNSRARRRRRRSVAVSPRWSLPRSQCCVAPAAPTGSATVKSSPRPQAAPVR